MKVRFVPVYRACLLALLLAAFFSVWAGAQESPGATPPAASMAGSSNSPARIHALSFGLDNIEWLGAHLMGQPLWKYLASLIYIVLAFYVAKLTDYILNGWLKRLTEKTDTKYDDLVLELVRGPVKIVAFVIFLNIGLGVFDWPARAQKILSHALIIVVACSITYVVLKFVDLFLGIWRERIVSAEDRQFADQLIPLAGKTVKVIILIAAALLTADNLQIEIKTLLAGLSVGGLALGLAAQDTVANLFGAVAIFMDKPFHIGDRVKVDSVDGNVEAIGLRSTRIRSLDGHLVAVPNKLMGNAIITNISRRPTIKTEMNIGLTYDTPTEKVKRATAVLEEIFRSNPRTADLLISFNKFTDSSLNIIVVHFWKGTDVKQHFAEMQELNLRIKAGFDAERIGFAFPTQTIHLKSDARN